MEFQRDKRKEFYERVRDRVAITKAVQVVNEVINGADVPRQQAQMAWRLVDKALPAYQAMAVDVSVTHATSIQDVNSRLLMAGIKPETAWALLMNEQQVIEHVKTSAESTSSEGPPTRESESE